MISFQFLWPIVLLWFTHHLTLAKHVAIIGHLNPSDILLHNQNIFVPGRKAGKIAHKFYYKQKSDPKVISAIVLTNNHRSSFGAEGALLDGGPNNIYCFIKFSARRNYYLDFNIKIYSNNKTLKPIGK